MNETMIALDPSSAVVGYAVFVDGRSTEIGRLTADKPSAPADARIDSLMRQLEMLLTECGPTVCVIEQPAWARPGRNVKVACMLHRVFGETRRQCIRAGAVVEYVQVNTWKRGQSKASAVAIAAATVKGYANDEGGDAADALGLGRWWLTCRKFGGVSASSVQLPTPGRRRASRKPQPTGRGGAS